jgi:hypothetical protein
MERVGEASKGRNILKCAQVMIKRYLQGMTNPSYQENVPHKARKVPLQVKLTLKIPHGCHNVHTCGSILKSFIKQLQK